MFKGSFRRRLHFFFGAKLAKAQNILLFFLFPHLPFSSHFVLSSCRWKMMSASHFDFTEHPHRRHNPLTNRSVLVSPHRAQRPWQGQVEPAAEEQKPTYDPKCYLCPGNSRAGGKQNPKYDETFVFTNDFAALLPDTPSFEQQE